MDPRRGSRHSAAAGNKSSRSSSLLSHAHKHTQQCANKLVSRTHHNHQPWDGNHKSVIVRGDQCVIGRSTITTNLATYTCGFGDDYLSKIQHNSRRSSHQQTATCIVHGFVLDTCIYRYVHGLKHHSDKKKVSYTCC